jgi:uncharacterized membrane protein
VAGSHRRTSPEFARVANLSDAVFAIAMTLLVLTLDPSAIEAGRVAAGFVEQLPSFIAFLLAFALVANLWWQHHRLFARFDAIEPGTAVLNLALLGAVALTPFPTSVIGSAPTDRAAVLSFIGLFIVLSVLFLLLTIRARSVAALTVGERDYYTMLGQWGAGLVVLVVAALVAVWWPVVALAIVAATIVLGPLASPRGTASRDRLLDRYAADE